MMPIYKEKTLIAFKKAHTLLTKIVEMTEKDVYCIDIMQQNLAVMGLLKSAHQLMMQNHLNSCFKHAANSKNTKKQQEMINEILKVIKMYNK